MYRVMKTIVNIVLILSLLVSCSLLFPPEASADKSVEISSISLSKSSLTLSVGELQYITYSVKPSSAQIKPVWNYNSTIIEITERNQGVIVSAIKEGQTELTVSYGSYSATCIVAVSGFSEGYKEEPYIYSNVSILQMVPDASETIHVSLFGGTAADIDGYTWLSDNPDVVSVSATGQYCVVKTLREGYARIKVTHAKAALPYYIGVYCFKSNADAVYITTESNILTLNAGVFSVTTNRNTAIITPLKHGQGTLRVTNPQAPYPLDIVIRVIEVVDQVAIEPSKTVVEINGTSSPLVTATLTGINKVYSVDDFVFSSDESVFTCVSIGNQVSLSGVSNGSANLVIAHPLAKYTRKVLVIVEGQKSGAVDSSMYITTSQNYIRTKVGADTQSVTIMLKGGSRGDEKNFTWAVSSSASDGTGKEVIRLETTDGQSVSSRAASATYASGIAYITPLAEGIATITLTHPKIVYPTEILVKVLPSSAVLENPLYFTGESLIKILNGTERNVSVTLKGDNKTPDDDQRISWSSEDSSFTIIGNGTSALLKATGTGARTGYVTASHPKADNSKRILILSADTEEELASYKLLYADKLYYNLNVGGTQTIYASSAGFGESETFQTVRWASSKPSVATVERNPDYPLSAEVTGVSSGNATITASIDGASPVSFTVTVYPKDTPIGTIEPDIFMTTAQNVVNLASPQSEKAVYVTPVGLGASEYHNIVWSQSDSSVARVVSNGASATITALTEGETVLTVSHEKSQNALKIYVRVGNEYVYPESRVVYISSSTEVLSVTRNSPVQRISAVLVNSTDPQESGFTFSIDNPDIARISAQYPTGNAFIQPVSSGQAELTISHPKAIQEKKVLLLIGNTEEELSSLKYLTTAQNVVNVVSGNTKTVSVSVKNSTDIILNGYSWVSGDPSIVSVVTTSGSTAVLQGNSPGTTTITVKNENCPYPLNIIVSCIDPSAAVASPFIQTSSSVQTLTVGTSWTTVNAELYGGKEEDVSDFTWGSSDPSVLQVYGQGATGKVRAIASGTAYVTISHPKAVYPSQILCICDEPVQSNCVISVPQSILSLKPNDTSQTISATLVNGTAEDRYNFRWSLDVYDIVSLDYSANVASITPLKQGQATLTVSHPKSAYSQQIIIKVTEFSNFAFGASSKTITQGKTAYVSMQVPSSSLSTHIKYTSRNPAVCAVYGTNAISQLTGVGPGTTIVDAELIVTATNTVLSKAEILVSVEEAQTALVYITSSSTTYTMEAGTNKTLTATLTGSGVLPTDQYNLKWKSSNPEVVTIRGTSSTGVATGQSVYIEAVKAGEATITVSHEKSNSELTMYIYVPGKAEQTITLNKSYVQLEKASSTDIKASISGAASGDYGKIEWSIDKSDGESIARVMGSGQTVSIYAIAVGETTLRARLPNGSSASCQVIIESSKSFTFASNTVSVQPVQSKVVKYTVSPQNAGLTWVQSSDEFFAFTDNGNVNGEGTITIEGIKEGTSTLSCVTSYGNKGTLQIRCAWDYKLNLGKTMIKAEPRYDEANPEKFIIPYEVNPTDARIVTSLSKDSIADVVVDSANKRIPLTPRGEGDAILTVRAYNPVTNQEFPNMARECKLYFNYDSITIIPAIINQDGNFSRYSPEAALMYLGDGESVTLSFSVLEPNVAVKFSGLNSQDSSSALTIEQVAGTTSWKVSYPEDYIEQEYLLEKQVRAYYLLGGVKTYYTPDWSSGSSHSKANRTNIPLYDIVSDEPSRMSISDFRANSSYWKPFYSCNGAKYPLDEGGMHDGHGNGGDRVIHPYARLVPKIDKTVISQKTQVIRVTFVRNGKEDFLTIPIILEKRACTKNQE